MKRLLLLLVLAVCAPALHAQEVAPAKTELAQIDPAARDLLARLTARYQKFGSFESLIIWQIGEAGKGLEPRRFRVQMKIGGKFVVGEEFPDKSWRKAICDGETLVEFRSKFPRTYTRKSVKSPFYLGLRSQLQSTLHSVGAEGPLISLLLTDDFGAALLEPELQSVKIQDDGARTIVVIRHQAFVTSDLPDRMNELKLTIDPKTLTLESAELSDEEGVVFTETYAQTYFNSAPNPALFRAAAPLGYKLVPYFPDEATTVVTPPVNITQ